MFRKRTLDAKSAIFHFAFDSSFFGFRDLGEQRVWTLELWPSRSEVIENRYPSSCDTQHIFAGIWKELKEAHTLGNFLLTK